MVICTNLQRTEDYIKQLGKWSFKSKKDIEDFPFNKSGDVILILKPGSFYSNLFWSKVRCFDETLKNKIGRIKGILDNATLTLNGHLTG